MNCQHETRNGFNTLLSRVFLPLSLTIDLSGIDEIRSRCLPGLEATRERGQAGDSSF